MPATTIITVALNPAIDRAVEVDRLVPGSHQVGRELARIPGGKAVNVSRVLDALGVRNVATGLLGEENRGVFAPLFASGRVSDEFFSLPGRTRENITITDRQNAIETHIRMPGLEVPARQLERLTKKLLLLAGADSIVVFSGSLPPGVSVEDFAKLVDACVSAGARVALDTSGDALGALAGHKLWLVKPNAAELSLLVGRELATANEQVEAARRLVGPVETVLLSRGADGAWLFDSELALHARVDLAGRAVRNTVGCGDALLAAFLAGVWREQPVRYCLRDAVACASAAALTPTSAEFDADVYTTLQDQAELTEI